MASTFYNSSAYQYTVYTSSTLALTTTFQPPPSCTGTIYNDLPVANDKWEGHNTILRGFQQSCFPDGYDIIAWTDSPAQTTTHVQNRVDVVSYAPFFSPGVCPLGYHAVSQQVNSSTTFATCCQSVFATMRMEDDGNLCEIHSGQATAPTYSFYGLGSLAPKPNSTVPNGGVLAYPITVAWREADLSLFAGATPAITPAASTISSSSTASALGPNSQASADVSRSSNSVSATTAAGIGIGGTFAIIVLIAALLFMRRRRKNAAARALEDARTISDDANSHQDEWKTELGAEERAVFEKSGDCVKTPLLEMHAISDNVRYEMSGKGVSHEMYGGDPAYEMGPRSTIVAELDGNWRGWEAPQVPPKPAKAREDNMF